MSRPALQFLGGVGTVTGSKFLVSSGDVDVLVDCGLFQGLSALRRRNWEPPPLDLKRLKAVVLSHAHLDHSGYLPMLARHGWDGPVYCTSGTARLAEIVLADSAHLLEEEARYANEGGWSKHKPALPLYDGEDVLRAVKLFHPVKYGEATQLPGGATLTLGRAGHILGSSWVQLDLPSDGASSGPTRRVVFSGDLGRPSHPLLVAPDPRPTCDALLIESTYGNRTHEIREAEDRLAEAINRTIFRGGTVLVPAFAVDRTEVILFNLARLRSSGQIPNVPIVVDSPMALKCLDVYREAMDEGWSEIREGVARDPFGLAHVIQSHTAEESAQWNDPRMPAIVISASGMASGGRVLHHLRHLLPHRDNTVIIAGYAAVGTRGRQLADGATQVKIHGQYVPVRAEILQIDAFSAHADADELYAWATATEAPGTCYLVHGEEEAAHAFARRLRREADWNAVVPREDERVVV